MHFLKNESPRNAVTQSHLAYNMNYEYFSSFNAKSTYHSFWNGAYTFMNFKFFNSTFSYNSNDYSEYGTFMTIQVPVQNTNSSGKNTIISFESTNSSTIEYVNLLYAKTTPTLCGIRYYSSNNYCKYFFVFSNCNWYNRNNIIF